MRKLTSWTTWTQRGGTNRGRLLLGTFAVAAILACAGCIVLGTVVGATLNYRARVTEEIAIRATATAQTLDFSAVGAAAPVTDTLVSEEAPPPEVGLPATPTPEIGATLPATDTSGPVGAGEAPVDQSPAPSLEAANLITPTGTTAALLPAQPQEIPGPSQALELTPTAQLTLSAVIFVENVGQLPSDVRFQVRGATGGGVWLASDAIWLTLLESPDTDGVDVDGPSAGQGVRLRFSFVGANPDPQIVPFDRLDTRASYFLGSDPAGWHTDVPVWGGVRYREIYPGVDLEVSGADGQYSQRLVVQPGADLSSIRLRVDGAQNVALEPLPSDSGDLAAPQTGLYYLRLTTAIGELALPLLDVSTPDGSHPPAVDSPRLEDVEGSAAVAWPFFLRSAPRAPARSTQVLPATSAPADETIHLLYSAFLGRGGTDANYAIAVDALGSAYVAGDTYFATVPAEPGAFDAGTGGEYAVSAAKIDSTGSELAYVAFLGGSGDEVAYGIAVDRAGNAILAGRTTSPDLPVTASAFDTQHHAGADGFVIGLNALGTGLQYATFLGGDGDDSIRAIALDPAGNAYLTGATRSTDFPATVGAQDVDYNGDLDAFVARLDATGAGLVYSTFLGGSSADRGTAIAVDGTGNAYVAGTTLSSDLDTAGAPPAGYHGNGDAFVVKVDSTATTVAYVTFIGGSEADEAASIAVDADGNAYVTGATRSPDMATTPWAFDTTFHGGLDAFVAEINAAGDGLEYAAFLGGEGDDRGTGIAVDGFGYAYVTGSAGPFSLPQTIGAFDVSHNGQQDAFVIRVDELGTGLEYATFIGGSGRDRGAALAVDSMGSVYVAGASDSPDFAVELDRWQPAEEGYVPVANPATADAFTFKLSTGTPFLDLPIAYQTFGLAALGNVGDRGLGRVNSWFDHSYPNHSENNKLARWDGTTTRFSAASPSRIGESWYDGHGGIDFGWDVWNEPVYAAAPGTVIDTVTTCQVGQTSCGNYFGNRVWIDHGNGYATVYAHLKTVEVTRGTVITDPASQRLGIMGNTGRSLGTHLHFGLYYDRNADGQWTRGETVDPFGWAGSGRDPWSAPSRYLWKNPLFARQIAGLSAAGPAQASGVVLSSPSGLVTATIPAGALGAPVAVELWDVPPTGEPAAQWHSTGEAFWLRAGGGSSTAEFLEPIGVDVVYRPKDMVHLDPNRLTLYRWDGSAKTWTPLPTTTNTARHQVSAQTSEFGRFDLHAPLLCPSDSIEPDDDHGAALPVATDGSPVSRVFDIASDVDWFRVEAEKSRIYTVRTGGLAAGVATILKIYDPDSQAPLASARTEAGAAYVQWRPPFDGTYLIRVSPADGSATGCAASYELSVEEILSPERVTVAGPAEGKLGARYTFTATISPDGASQPVSYAWQIDSRLPVTHTAGLSDTLTITWSNAGSHSISVTASNVAGKATGTHGFAVRSKLVAGFTATPTSGQAPLPVSFADASTGDYTSMLWDLGDGSTSHSRNPTHLYTAAGTYTVTLTVEGPGGTDAQTRVGYITVHQPATVPKNTGYHVYLPNVLRNGH